VITLRQITTIACKWPFIKYVRTKSRKLDPSVQYTLAQPPFVRADTPEISKTKFFIKRCRYPQLNNPPSPFVRKSLPLTADVFYYSRPAYKFIRSDSPLSGYRVSLVCTMWLCVCRRCRSSGIFVLTFSFYKNSFLSLASSFLLVVYQGAVGLRFLFSLNNKIMKSLHLHSLAKLILQSSFPSKINRIPLTPLPQSTSWLILGYAWHFTILASNYAYVCLTFRSMQNMFNTNAILKYE